MLKVFIDGKHFQDQIRNCEIKEGQEFHSKLVKIDHDRLGKWDVYFERLGEKLDTAEEMRKRHQQELNRLKEECKHPEISDWMEEWWAPAHGTGFQVKTCKACEKVIARRTCCRKCGKSTEDYQMGSGTHSRPIGSYYCPACVERTEGEIKEDEVSQKQMDELGKKGKWY